jgi:hypothetical protein
MYVMGQTIATSVASLPDRGPPLCINNLEGNGEQVAELIVAALGLVDVDRPAKAMVWAFRRLFEVPAGARPLVLAFEDVHCAEPALLDLLEYVTRHAKAVPLLIVCLARPELLEARPPWAARRSNSRPCRRRKPMPSSTTSR